MPVALRPARADDAELLGALATQVFLDTYATNGLRPDLVREAGQTGDAKRFAALAEDPLARCIVAEEAAHLLGFTELRFDVPAPLPGIDSTAELVRLYLLRPARGRGLGRALIEAAEQAAAERGAAALWLTVWDGNAAAQAFYAACGYAQTGYTTYRFEDREYLNRVLVKPLA